MNNTTAPSATPIGFLGLGAMGGNMARQLLLAGYKVIGFDPNTERLTACVSAGATRAANVEEVVSSANTVLTSLRSSAVFVEVAEKHFLPNARRGQLFIDLGTTTAPETRRLAAALSAKGATLIDAPVSGGPQGAATGTLRIFVGGDAEAVKRCRPILEVLGEPKRVVYCGPTGTGQVVKGTNQLAMGLGVAAYMEAIAFAVRTGVNLEAIEQSVGGDDGWRAHFSGIAKQIMRGNGGTMVVKYPELPYFLEEAQAQGIEMPLTQALNAFLKDSKHDMLDNMNRPSRSFWRELIEPTT